MAFCIFFFFNWRFWSKTYAFLHHHLYYQKGRKMLFTVNINIEKTNIIYTPAIFKGKKQKGHTRKRSDFNFVFFK